MRKLLLLLVLLPFFANAQTDKRFADLDTFVNRVLKEWHAAGCAVAIVEKNKVVYTKGFGYKDFQKKAPATNNTLFAIGSCSKAFTASLLGMLEKEGKLNLDKPVHDYLPELQFYNEFLTYHVTPRDMMSHRTGLPRHDFSWYGANTTRDSLIYRIRFLEPSATLREKWQYNNFMFVAQGVLAEKLYGKKWETLVKEKILDPLGMTHSNFSVNDMQKEPDFTFGYREVKDSVVKVDYMNIDPIGPAGSINSNAKDMANWVIAWINGGKFNGKEVLPAAYVNQAISSQMVVSAGMPSKEVPDVLMSNYGFGWFLSSYRGHYRVEHGGNIDGFSASTCFYPADSIGIVVLTNQDGSAVPGVIRNVIADKLLGLPYRNWQKIQRDAFLKNRLSAGSVGAAPNADSLNRKKNTHPSHDLAAYAGWYEEPGYGHINIALDKDTLWVNYNKSVRNIFLRHYHYDVFDVVSVDDPKAPANSKLRFNTDYKGEINSFETQMEPTVKDIVFTRVNNFAPAASELQVYVGDYEMIGQTVKVYIRGGNTLMVLVPGQPDYELVPTKKNEFDLKVAKGFSVKFEPNSKGEIVSLTFVQPNGLFKAIRKQNKN